MKHLVVYPVDNFTGSGVISTCKKTGKSVILSRAFFFFVVCVLFFAALSSFGSMPYTAVFLLTVPARNHRSSLLTEKDAADDIAVTFEKKWSAVVETEQVSDFRVTYLRDCANYSDAYTIDIEDARYRNLPEWAFGSRGLGSALHGVVSAFALSQFVNPPRRFHLMAKRWNYGDFRHTFSDFSDKSDCPVNNFTPAKANRKAEVFIDWDGEVVIDGPDAFYEPNILPPVREHVVVYRFLPYFMGYENYFNVLSVTARAFLTPREGLLELIRRIWTELGGSYVVIHIRRGDKKEEVGEVPISKYVSALQIRENRPRNVFLMCDGRKTCDEFSLALGAEYHLITYQSLMEQWGLWTAEKFPDEHSQVAFDRLPEEDRLLQTKELVVSLFVGALSDFVICTYSSNICRLIALLRGGRMHHNGVDSVDWKNWRIAQ